MAPSPHLPPRLVISIFTTLTGAALEEALAALTKMEMLEERFLRAQREQYPLSTLIEHLDGQPVIRVLTTAEQLFKAHEIILGIGREVSSVCVDPQRPITLGRSVKDINTFLKRVVMPLVSDLGKDELTCRKIGCNEHKLEIVGRGSIASLLLRVGALLHEVTRFTDGVSLHDSLLERGFASAVANDHSTPPGIRDSGTTAIASLI